MQGPMLAFNDAHLRLSARRVHFSNAGGTLTAGCQPQGAL